MCVRVFHELSGSLLGHVTLDVVEHVDATHAEVGTARAYKSFPGAVGLDVAYGRQYVLHQKAAVAYVIQLGLHGWRRMFALGVHAEGLVVRAGEEGHEEFEFPRGHLVSLA